MMGVYGEPCSPGVPALVRGRVNQNGASRARSGAVRHRISRAYWRIALVQGTRPRTGTANSGTAPRSCVRLDCCGATCWFSAKPQVLQGSSAEGAARPDAPAFRTGEAETMRERCWFSTRAVPHRCSSLDPRAGNAGPHESGRLVLWNEPYGAALPMARILFDRRREGTRCARHCFPPAQKYAERRRRTFLQYDANRPYQGPDRSRRKQNGTRPIGRAPFSSAESLPRG